MTPRAGMASVWRLERYDSHDDGRSYAEKIMAVDAHDATPRNPTYPNARYDSRCSCCFLNIPHTTAQHDASIPR